MLNRLLDIINGKPYHAGDCGYSDPDEYRALIIEEVARLLVMESKISHDSGNLRKIYLRIMDALESLVPDLDTQERVLALIQGDLMHFLHGIK